jgi:hypothetical protein
MVKGEQNMSLKLRNMLYVAGLLIAFAFYHDIISMALELLRYTLVIVCGLLVGCFPFAVIGGSILLLAGVAQMFSKGIPRGFGEFIKGLGIVIASLAIYAMANYMLVRVCGLSPDSVRDAAMNSLVH